MKSEAIILFVIIVCFNYENSAAISVFTCGLDKSKTQVVQEGVADIRTYPWLGVLIYPRGSTNDWLKTTVVLISTQMALASALDIDKYPKDSFRANSRVVLGRNCSRPYIRVLNYNFHPDFSKNTYSTIVMLQLDTVRFWRRLGLRAICRPPNMLKNVEVYAMTLTEDCTNKMVRVYKMEYVDPSECKDFYRRAELDIASMWPTHVACARATRDGHCVWRSGTILAMRDHDQWRLLGFGVNGPGCESPARFLDYGMYYPWVRKSLSRMGKPAFTRLGPGELIIRRSLGQLQRYGECDGEETKAGLFNDYTSIVPDPKTYHQMRTIFYNLTLLSNVDYSCLKLKVTANHTKMYPYLGLRRWCSNPMPTCYDFNVLQINFVVFIKFYEEVSYELQAYGKEIKFIDTDRYRKYAYDMYFADNRTLPPIEKWHHKYSMDWFRTPNRVPDVLFSRTGVYKTLEDLQKANQGLIP